MDYTAFWSKLETLRGRLLIMVIKRSTLVGDFRIIRRCGLSVILLIVGLSIIEVALYRPESKTDILQVCTRSDARFFATKGLRLEFVILNVVC